jgi:hypothetical protein
LSGVQLDSVKHRPRYAHANSSDSAG